MSGQVREEPARGLDSWGPALREEAGGRSVSSTVALVDLFGESIHRQIVAIANDSSYDSSLRALMRAAAGRSRVSGATS